MGKPDPSARRQHSFQFLLAPWHLDGRRRRLCSACRCRWTGGETPSTISNQFIFPVATPPPPPTLQLRIVYIQQIRCLCMTTGTVGVTAGSGCAWTAASDADGSTSPAARTAAEMDRQLSVDAEPDHCPRIGRLTVAGRPSPSRKPARPAAIHSPPAHAPSGPPRRVAVSLSPRALAAHGRRELLQLADRREWRQRYRATARSITALRPTPHRRRARRR